MSGFAKLFASIVTSSIWVEDDATLRVWVAMLATADAEGVVEGSIPGFANLARVTPDQMRAAISTLAAPDTDSRTPDFGGRRIEVVEGGWRILNYAAYRLRGQGQEGSRAPYYRAYRRQQKAKAKAVQQDTQQDTQQVDVAHNADVADHAENTQRLGVARNTEAEAEAEAEERTTAPPLRGVRHHLPVEIAENFSASQKGTAPNGDNYRVIANLAGQLLDAGGWTCGAHRFTIGTEADLVDALKDECARLHISQVVPDVVHRAAAAAWTKRRLGVGRGVQMPPEPRSGGGGL